MDQLYHGFITKNADEMNKLISSDEKCRVPSENCFWKHPRDIKNCQVKPRNHTKKEPIVNIEDYNNYFKQKQ